MDKSGGNDDSRAELPQDSKDHIVWRHKRRHQNGRKDTNGAGGENDKEKTDSQTDIVVPLHSIAGCNCLPVTAHAVSAVLLIMVPGASRTSRYNILDTSVEMAALPARGAPLVMVVVAATLGLQRDLDVIPTRRQTKPGSCQRDAKAARLVEPTFRYRGCDTR